MTNVLDSPSEVELTSGNDLTYKMRIRRLDSVDMIRTLGCYIEPDG